MKFRIRYVMFPVAAFILMAATACAPPKVGRPPTDLSPPADLVLLVPEQVPALTDDQAYNGLDRAIAQSLTYLARVPAGQSFRFGPHTYDRSWMVRSLEHFRGLLTSRPDGPTLHRQILTHYRVYRSEGNDRQGGMLFTGYYEPILDGCLRPGPACPYPVYGLPEDLVTINLSLFDERFADRQLVGRLDGQTVVPYPDRQAIEAQKAFSGKAPVLAWVSDPLELFFLHIQGSGRIRLAEGGSLGLGYRAGNGRPYRSIGKLLMETGEIPRDKMSMQAIKTFLRANPHRLAQVLAYNPSYVFFQINASGPQGSLAVPLTAGRSIATDPDRFPKAALAFVESQKPLIADSDRIAGWVPFGRFMLNQDTGGAIRGPGRADLFWGSGRYAELAAGSMQHPGALYFLVLKPQP